MRIEELIRQLEENPEEVRRSPKVRTPEVFAAWIRRCLELTSANPREGLPHVGTALKIANTKCEIVQCYGVKAAAQRYLGELDKAQRNLDIAFEMGSWCAACEADLLRRRAHLNTSLGNTEEALRDADAAIAANELLLPEEDHNLFGHGLADSYFSRGDIRQHFGDVTGSIADFSKVLTFIDPLIEQQKALYGLSLSALATCLYYQGGFDNLKLANEHMREAWKYFNGRKHEASREKAHLTWQTAMIRFELRKHPEGLEEVKDRPATLRGLLERSRDDFIEVNMPAESAAVASDLSQALFPKRTEIIEVMDDTFGLIRNRWASFTPEIRQAFVPVRKAMGVVRLAADHDVMITTSEEHHSRMRAAIERLRDTCAEAAQGQLLPCLLSWPRAT